MSCTQTQTQVFAAAHPIFDRKLKVAAYDVEFRSGFGALCDEMANRAAPVDICESIGLEGMVGLTKAHILFPRWTVVMDLPVLFPPEMLIVGIDKGEEADPELVQACQQLAEVGYQISAPYPGAGAPGSPILEFLNIVRVDVAATPESEQAELCEDLWGRGVQAMAVGVDAAEGYDDLPERGYWFFQGDFFRRPLVKPGREIPANKLRYLQLLEKVNQPELPLDELAELVKQDVTMTFRLLRFINSAWFGLRAPVESIRHALVLLGPPEIRKWASMLVLSSLGEDKPEELFRRCLLRAHMAESIAPHVGLGARAAELFLMGMFSLVDALTDIPLARVLRGLPLSRDITMALLAKRGEFAQVQKLVAAYEQGKWSDLTEASQSLHIEESALPGLFAASRRWADAAMLTLSST